MSVAAVQLVDKHSQARGAARSVLNRLALHAQERTNLAWPTTAKLAIETGYSQRHVQRLLAELVDAGEVIRHGFRGDRAVYLVTPHAPGQSPLFTDLTSDAPVASQVTLPATHTSRGGDTYVRACINGKDKKDSNTPPAPQGGSAPDLSTAFTNGNRRRRSRGQHPTPPAPGEPCPGRRSEFETYWRGVAEQLRGVVGESAFEIWLLDAHPHDLGDAVSLAVHPGKVQWVRTRFGKLIARLATIPVSVVGCAELEERG